MEKQIFQCFADVAQWWRKTRADLEKLVFTNGCFDLLHAGHVTYLEEARGLGTFLVVGLNSDASVTRLKGPLRPLNHFDDRAKVLSGLECVDLVVGFDEDTPLELIQNLNPDVLVKGGDWPISDIVGSDWVIGRGGQVRSLSLVQGQSTSQMIERILNRYQKK